MAAILSYFLSELIKLFCLNETAKAENSDVIDSNFYI